MLKNTIRPSRTMPCQFFNQGMCSHSATHETKGVLYKHVCSFCFTSANKTFPHTESECRNKKRNASKKRGSQGMSHFGTHAHRSRQLFTSSKKEGDLRLELGSSKATWSHWFIRNKAFPTKTDNRTYAQVVSHKNPCIPVVNPNPNWVPVKPSVETIIVTVQRVVFM